MQLHIKVEHLLSQLPNIYIIPIDKKFNTDCPKQKVKNKNTKTIELLNNDIHGQDYRLHSWINSSYLRKVDSISNADFFFIPFYAR